MSVGVLLVSHLGIGSALLDSARRILRVLPLKVQALELPWDHDCLDPCQRQAAALLRELDEGEGVLVLADLYGASPFNAVQSLEPGRALVKVSGLNLPMLLRVCTYPEKSLSELADIAREGGRAGVVRDA